MLNKILLSCSLAFTLTISCYANNEKENKFSKLEESRLRIFETLYPKSMQTDEQKEKILQTYFTITQDYEIYTFPNQNIANVYQAYLQAYPQDSFGPNVLHKELPLDNKAFKANSDPQRLGYVLMYVWDNENHLTITNTRIDGETFCAREILQFEQEGQNTILKSSFEQYCFN